jgi:hypothetical protein
MSDLVEDYIKEIKTDIGNILELQRSIVRNQERLNAELTSALTKIHMIKSSDKITLRELLKKKMQRVANKEDRFQPVEPTGTTGFCVHCTILITSKYGIPSKESNTHCQDCFDRYHKKI